MVSPAPEPKHVACARCRDRKVKCDGGKPGCKRCHRNGTPCRYVRGKKQQTRNEWLQHLRTFSSQPGRVNVTRSLSRTSSQPALPQTPHLQPHYLEEDESYTRSSSPYLFEHVAIVDESDPDAPMGGSPLQMGQTSTEECNRSAPWLPLSTGYRSTHSHTYLFRPAGSFCNTDYATDIFPTMSSQPLYALNAVSTRPYTPVSHTSETTSSIDGLSETSLAYDATFHRIPVGSQPMTWPPTTPYAGHAGKFPSPNHSSPYS